MKEGKVKPTAVFEENILRNVYHLESKRTAITIGKYLFVVLLLAWFILLLSISITKIFAEQQTLTILELFQEDQEIIFEFLPDAMSILYYESPKLLLFLSLSFTLLLAVIVYFFVRNFAKLKRKLIALLHTNR